MVVLCYLWTVAGYSHLQSLLIGYGTYAFTTFILVPTFRDSTLASDFLKWFWAPLNDGRIRANGKASFPVLTSLYNVVRLPISCCDTFVTVLVYWILLISDIYMYVAERLWNLLFFLFLAGVTNGKTRVTSESNSSRSAELSCSWCTLILLACP